MTATTQPAAAQTIPRTESMLKRARQSDTFRELIPGNAALGWPAIDRIRGQVFLRMPVFDQQRRPDGAVNLYPPFAVLTVGWAPPRIAAYVDLSTDRFWAADGSVPVGIFPHAELGDSEQAYLMMRRELFACYDAICLALNDGHQPTARAAKEFSRLLRALLEPGLERYYRALAPDFFSLYLPAADAPPAATETAPAHQPPIERASLGRAPSAPTRLTRSAVFEELGTLVAESRRLVALSESESLVAQLHAIEARRMQTRGVIALVGRRKSGRSTIGNILLDAPVLPSRTTASTASAVRIVPGAITRLTLGDHAYLAQDLDQAWPALQSSDGSPIATDEAVLELQNSWVRETEVEILDLPGIDTPGADVAYRHALQADLAVMTVAAMNPLDLGERAFVDLAADHQVPVLIVITQLDRIEEAERESLVDEIQSRAHALDAVAAVLVPDGYAGRPSSSELRGAIEPWLVNNLRAEQRVRQSLAALRLLANELILTGEGLAEISRLDAEERRREARLARVELDAMRRNWDRLSLDIERLQVDYMKSADRWFDQEQANLHERLLFDLAHQPNPKMWLERDLPYALRRELTATANRAERSLQEKLASDLQRISTQLSDLGGAGSRLTPAAVAASQSAGAPRLDDLELRNIELIRPLAAGGGLLGGLLAAGAAIPGAFPIALILSSLSGEFMRKQAAAQQREAIATELGRVLSELFAYLRRAFVDEVRSVYADALAQLRDQRESWLKGRLRALEGTEQATARHDGEQLREGAEALAGRLASMLGDEGAK